MSASCSKRTFGTWKICLFVYDGSLAANHLGRKLFFLAFELSKCYNGIEWRTVRNSDLPHSVFLASCPPKITHPCLKIKKLQTRSARKKLAALRRSAACRDLDSAIASRSRWLQRLWTSQFRSFVEKATVFAQQKSNVSGSLNKILFLSKFLEGRKTNLSHRS